MKLLVFAFLLIACAANAEVATIHFTPRDKRSVCKLLNAVVFTTEKQIGDFAVEVTRTFETKSKNFKLQCIQKREMGSLFAFYEEATAQFDNENFSDDTKVLEDGSLIQATLTNKDDMSTLFEQAMHFMPFYLHESISMDDHGQTCEYRRMKITCERKSENSLEPQSCTITAVKN